MLLLLKFKEILRDKIIEENNYDKQNYPLCILKLLVEKLYSASYYNPIQLTIQRIAK